MLTNLWKKITFYCMNGHEEPVQMTVQYGESAFYACPQYFEFSNEHPDGHFPSDKPCYNRMSFSDAEKVISKFSRIIETDMSDNTVADYRGIRITYKHIDATVLKYSDQKIKIGILNRMAVHR